MHLDGDRLLAFHLFGSTILMVYVPVTKIKFYFVVWKVRLKQGHALCTICVFSI